jgi:chromate reductase, NAD(P)H dehydrogenase (quinone)
MRLLAVAGSLRRASYNLQLLRAAAALLPPAVASDEFDGLKAIPPFDEDDEPAPGGAVNAWRTAIRDADAVLFATPEYNSSVPGALKNAVDWASRPFSDPVLRNKPVAVIGASTGMFGAVWAQAELRKSLAAAGARVLDQELPVAAADEAFDGSGALRDPDLSLTLRGILAELIDAAERRAAAA